MKIPQKIEKTLYVLLCTSGCLQGRIMVTDSNMSTNGGWAVLQTVSFETELDPNIDVKNILVKNLQAQKDKLKADHYIAVAEVDRKIAELLALPSDSTNS
ncbi:MAG: hypothetical protein [Bacteriophage sp.]|nr:MAG: hypothetical protein [Bacteriophage sp.]